MRKQLLGSMLFVAGILPVVSIPMMGQFPAESTIPKAKRGKRRPPPPAKASKPAPRIADGKVDLSAAWGYAGYTSDIAKDYDVGEVPMTPLGEKLFKERQDNLGKDDPEARCLPTGVPRRDPYPTKLIQTPSLVAILFEGNIHSFRQIFLDQKEHPKDLNPTWYGHSIGHWEGNDELVIDTVGFNGQIWLDMAGHATSDQLHVIERLSRPDFDHLKNEITIIDPVMYTKPWKVTEITPILEGDLIEYICTENERDVRHLDALK